MTLSKEKPPSSITTRFADFDISALIFNVLCLEHMQNDVDNKEATSTNIDTPCNIDVSTTSDDSSDEESHLAEIAELLRLPGTTSTSPPTAKKRKRRQSTTSPHTAHAVSSTTAPTTSQPNRKQRRRLRRTQLKQDKGYNGRVQSPLVDNIRIHADVIESTIPLDTLPADRSGYTALNEKAGARREAPLSGPTPQTLPDFLARGFTVLPAKNKAGATCITDIENRVFAVREEFDIEGWNATAENAHDAIRKEWPNVASWDPHRGVHSYNFGCYHGKGLTKMSWMYGDFADFVTRLQQNPDHQRLAAQVSAALAKWFPKIYADAHRRMLHIIETLGFPRTFPTSVFTTLAVNFGPRTTTIKHRDWTDKAGEMCAVQALGRYDHTKGGHLVLWDLKLLIEFPPGSLILFPSAVLSHSNVAVQEHEERTSLVHYTPGNVCRFVDNEFHTEKYWWQRNKKKYATIVQAKLTRWQQGLSKLSTVDDVRAV